MEEEDTDKFSDIVSAQKLRNLTKIAVKHDNPVLIITWYVTTVVVPTAPGRLSIFHMHGCLKRNKSYTRLYAAHYCSKHVFCWPAGVWDLFYPGPQVKEYDAISRIDAWLTAQLLHIKKRIDSDETIN